MIATLSGFEGSGKSTIVDYLKNKENYLVVPETARMLLPLEGNVFEDSNDDMSYKSFIAYLSSSHFIFENDLNKKNNIIFDRNIIDSLTFLDLYSEQKIDTNKLQQYLDKFLKEKNQKTLYSSMILLRHPTNKKHIQENILTDKVRKYSSSVKQYIEDGQKWENTYLENFNKLKNISEHIFIMDSYPENKNIIKNLQKVLNIKKKILKNK